MKTLLEIEPAYVEPLRAAGLSDFDSFMHARAAGPPTSKHKHRETVPLDIPIDGQVKRFFLKRVFRVPPRHAIVPLIRLRAGFSQPRREWDTLRKLDELGQLGIAAMKRVAVGERQVAGIPVSAFLLVEAAPMQHTLENWLIPGFEKPRPALGPRERKRLLYELGRLLVMLAPQFRWPDVHPKHIFARPAENPRKRWTWEFCLIDVERMTESALRPCYEITEDCVPIYAPALEELGLFVRNLRPLALSRHDLVWLWAGYCAVLRAGAGPRLRRGSRLLPEWTTLDEGPRLPDDYEHPRANDLAVDAGMRIDHRAINMLARAGVHRADDVFALENGENLRKPGLASHRDRIRLDLTNGDGNPHTLYFKRYRRPPVGQQLRRIVAHESARSSAQQESHFIKELSLLGIPTVKRIADGQEMIGPWEKRSFIITEGLNGVSLERLLQQAAKDPSVIPTFEDRREIIRQLALIVRLMHRNELFHRDLYLSHVFLTRNADGQIVLRVIDLARMIEKPLRPRRWRIKDLAALDYSATSLVTRADRIRFLRTYYDVKSSRDQLRREISAIRARSARMARHDTRRARRISQGASA